MTWTKHYDWLWIHGDGSRIIKCESGPKCLGRYRLHRPGFDCCESMRLSALQRMHKDGEE